MEKPPEVKPIFTKMLSCIPDPDRKRISFLLEDECQEKHKFSLELGVAYQFLAALLQKSISPAGLNTTAHYPTPLKEIAHSKEMSSQSCMQMIFPSGLPVTIEFPRGIEDVDLMIKVLELIKQEMINNPSTKH